MKEALAYARGDTTLGRTTVIRVPDVDPRAIRLGLGMTQVEFARRFAFSLATLRDWEQARRRPDGPARVLLAVIAREPQAVDRALGTAS